VPKATTSAVIMRRFIATVMASDASFFSCLFHNSPPVAVFLVLFLPQLKQD
jgi:hypothetical protein